MKDNSKSDAIHNIYIDTLDASPAQSFPPTDYVTLGHVRQAQVIDGTNHIRYYGSSIALSFDECSKNRCTYLMGFETEKLSAVENPTISVAQPLAVLRSDLTAITTQPERWRGISQEPPIWLNIEITTDSYLHDMQRKIRALAGDLPVEVLLVRRSREQRERIIASERHEMLSESNATEVFDRRLVLEEPEESQRERLNQLFSATLHTLAGESEV